MDTGIRIGHVTRLSETAKQLANCLTAGGLAQAARAAVERSIRWPAHNPVEEARTLPLFEFEGRRPNVHPTAFIAPTATLVGDVTVEAEASVWYGAVLRGDFAPVIVHAGANVQDGSVLHAPPDLPVVIGAGATVAHLCVFHGATLGEEALVANGATVLDGAAIGSRSMIAAGAVVRAGEQIPDGVLAAGVPAVVKGPIAGTPSEIWVTMNPSIYRDLARRHRDGVAPVG